MYAATMGVNRFEIATQQCFLAIPEGFAVAAVVTMFVCVCVCFWKQERFGMSLTNLVHTARNS